MTIETKAQQLALPKSLQKENLTKTEKKILLLICFKIFILEKMAHQLNASCNFNLGYLICDIPDNTMQMVVKIKMTFGKHTLVEDQEQRMVKYRPWGG